MSDPSSDDLVSISYDSDAKTYLARFDPDAITPSMAVVEAVATVRDTTTTDLDPLADTVDPMAIDRLSSGDETDDRVLEFRYLEHVVTVRSRGVIEILPLSDVGGG